MAVVKKTRNCANVINHHFSKMDKKTSKIKYYCYSGYKMFGFIANDWHRSNRQMRSSQVHFIDESIRFWATAQPGAIDLFEPLKRLFQLQSLVILYFRSSWRSCDQQRLQRWFCWGPWDGTINGYFSASLRSAWITLNHLPKKRFLLHPYRRWCAQLVFFSIRYRASLCYTVPTANTVK